MFAWVAVIACLSLIPGEDLPDIPILNIDKVFHVGVYGILWFLLMNNFNFWKAPASTNSRVLFSLFIVLAYGGFLELLQDYLFESRYADWLDVLANFAGGILAYLANIKLRWV